MEKLLFEMKSGERGTVKRIVADGKIKRRLFDMGVTPRAEVVFRKSAPLGDPIEINIRGYELTLRKSEAETVLVEVE